jgi:hypothetical protein
MIHAQHGECEAFVALAATQRMLAPLYSTTSQEDPPSFPMSKTGAAPCAVADCGDELGAVLLSPARTLLLNAAMQRRTRDGLTIAARESSKLLPAQTGPGASAGTDAAEPRNVRWR